MDEAKTLVVIVPAYNEEESIGDTLRYLRRLQAPLREMGVSMHICVVDDGSTDATNRLAWENGADDVLKHHTNLGLGAAVRSGIHYAWKRDFDYLVKFDADLQHEAGDIPKLIEPILNDEADIVYGNRFPKIEYRMPFMRRLGNRVFTSIMRFMTGWPVKDSQPGIFAVNRYYIAEANLPGDYNYTQQVLLDAYLRNLRFAQVPVTFRQREKGQTFITLVYPFKAIAQILLVIASTKPMKIFVPLGMFFCLLGFVVFSYQIILWFFGYTPKPVVNVNLVLGSVLFGIQTLFFGILAQLIVLTKK